MECLRPTAPTAPGSPRLAGGEAASAPSRREKRIARRLNNRPQCVGRKGLDPPDPPTCSTAASPGTASTAFRSVATPHSSYGYASGLLGRETPQPQHLETPRDEPMRNQAGYGSSRSTSRLAQNVAATSR